MKIIPIYKAEADVEGLADKVIASNRSKAYSKIEEWKPSETSLAIASDIMSKNGHAKASETDIDLFYLKSILVTTNWNLNDDVFDPVETWMARHSASHKPTNIEHDETRIVGHITETWAIDRDGNIIPEDTNVDDLPNPFHIANGAVIYQNYADEGLIDQSQKLISEIQAGTKYVSMEALFSDFWYSMAGPNGEYHVIARNQQTAFLTKHLRIFGGLGSYDGYKIGRVLKNIIFSGKGYVDRPGNPESVILSNESGFDLTKASTENPLKLNNGVFITYSQGMFDTDQNNKKTETKMTVEAQDFYKSEATELKAAAVSKDAEIARLQEAVSTAGIKSLQDEIDNQKAAVATSEEAKAEITDQLAKATVAVATLTEEKEAITVELATATTKIAEVELTALTAGRISTLIDGGVEKTLATEKVAIYASLSDEMFDSVAKDLIAVAKGNPFAKDEDKDKEDKDKKDKADATVDTAAADEADLDTAEATEDVDLSADASDASDTEEATAQEEFASAVATQLFGATEEATK